MRSALLAGLLAVGTAQAEPITVEDAVKRALELSPALQALKARRDASADQTRAVRGQLLPSVAVQEELQHYNGPFSVAFTIPGAPASPMFTARDQNTNTFALALRQPLVGLLHLSQDFVAAGRAEDALEAQVVAAEHTLTEQVQTAYLRLFEARAARDVAQSSQALLGEQLVVANARVLAGTSTSADVLRVEVARANMQQQELQAKVQESAAKTALLTMLELPNDAVEFVEPVALEAAGGQPAPSTTDATRLAEARRPEFTQATRQAESAEALARSRLFSLLPEVDAEAAYINVQGQAFAQKDSMFVGVKATWPVWVWGAQWYAHRAAVHQAEAARLLVADTRRQVRVEVSGRIDQLEAATAAIDVARKALESATEAFRVTSELVKAGSGTTTDLLDSQSALTQARLNLVRAKYQQAIARVQLERATGS